MSGQAHLVHAAPSAKGNSFDIGPCRWRAEGGSFEEKKEQAYRLAFTWNLAEGIPLHALEKGCVRRFYEAVDALLAVVGGMTGQPGEIGDLAAAAGVVREALAAHEQEPVDCPSCSEPHPDYPDAEEA